MPGMTIAARRPTAAARDKFAPRRMDAHAGMPKAARARNHWICRRAFWTIAFERPIEILKRQYRGSCLPLQVVIA